MLERRKALPRLAFVAVTSAIALILLSALVVALLLPYRSALAQSAPTGTISQDTAAHFGGVCTVLTDTIVSTADGGEIRLRATVEDYFDGDEIDASQWITGFSNSSYPDQAPLIGSGVLTLYGSFLRSAQVFSATTPVRFLEASAQFADDRTPSNADIGFYRAVTPTLQAQDPDSSIRLFISKPDHAGIDRLMYVRSRDGYVDPWVDSRVDNWGDQIENERVGLAQYLTYRIEWNEAETWFLIEGSPIAVVEGDQPIPHSGVSTRTTYAFLYNQDPLDLDSPDWDNTTPLLVDWIRAGAYPTSGVYISCAQDAGQIANWSQATVTATLPTSTSVILATRTSLDGISWSAWANAEGSVISGTATLTPTSPSGRYLQYRMTLSSSDPINSPEVGALDFSYFGAASIVVAPASATLNPGATQQFVAEVRDSRNSVVNSAPVTWSVTAGGGNIDNSGLFTAGLPAGVFTDTVTASAGNNVTGTATVTVLDLPPVADIGGPYTGVEDQAVELDASNSSDPNGGLVTYAWDLTGNGEYTDATDATPSYTWPDNGEYLISLLVTDGAGLTDTATTTVTIANVDPQIISIERNTPVRRGQPVTITVNASDVPSDTLSYSFDWTSNNAFDIENSPSNTAVTSYTATGLYTVTVRVADDDGGVVTTSTTVTVTPQVLSATASGETVRRGQSATVSVSSTQELSDALTYGFDFDNNGSYEVSSSTPSASTVYTTTGVKQVGVRVTDADGGVVTTSTTVTVTPQVLSATATNSGPVRRGQPVTVSVSAAQELSDVLTYGFDFGNNSVFEIVQTENSAAASFASTGVKTVGFGVTDSNGATVTGTTDIVVTPQLLTISAVSNSGPVLRNQPVTVIVTATQELSDLLTYSFDWDNDGIYEVMDQPHASAATTYSTAGEKTVRVRVRDADGGEAITTTTITVNAQAIQITSVTSDAPKRRGQQVTVVVTATQQLDDLLFYSFDWNNDGVYEVVDQASNSASTQYASTGEKTVRVRVRDAQNSEAVATTTLLITPQNLGATASNNGPVRRGQTATVTVTATQELNDALHYSFDWNDDGAYDVVDQPGSSASTQYALAGEKTVRVRVTDSDGGESTTMTMITVDPQNLSIVSVTNSGSVIVGDLVLVTVNAIQELDDPLFYSFDWNNDGSYEVIDQPLNSASTSYAFAGDKVVGVRVTDRKGAEATGVTTIEVTEDPSGDYTDFIFLPIVNR